MGYRVVKHCVERRKNDNCCEKFEKRDTETENSSWFVV